jgi:tetrapyrrole methylase family protein / MazG family protein
MTITIIGLGSGDIDDLTRKAWRLIENAETVYLRTERHPCVAHLPKRTEYISFDNIYEKHPDFSAVYAEIVERLLTEAQTQPVFYAVPGDPLVGEFTVTELLRLAPQHNIELEIVSGISFIEPMLRHVGIDALDGLQILDGMTIANMHHPQINSAFPAFVGGVYSRAVASDIKLTLMNQYPDHFEVVLVHGAGTEDVTLERVPLYEIDRSGAINHLTSLYLPAMNKHTSFESFQETIAHLRAPEGCPWDRKQTHASLRPYLLEETYEVLEAIDNEDWDELASEMGDLLLQIVLHTQIAIDDGEFYMTDILQRINEKMIRRHPHVWGTVDVSGSAEQVKANWDDIKKAENVAKGKEKKFILDKTNKAMPALMVAYDYTARAAKVGFDWESVAGVEDKVREELDEIFTATNNTDKITEIGDLLFVLVNWLRWLGNSDPESLMREANAKFYRRFTYIESSAQAQGKDLSEMTLSEMDALWNEAKREKGL